LPQVATSLEYHIETSNSPTTKVSIDLGDYSRTVDIGSSDLIAQEAIESLLNREIEDKTVFFGGANQRFPLMMIGFGLTWVLSVAFFNSKQKQAKTTYKALIMILISAAVPLATWAGLLEGTKIYSDDRSWLDANAGILTLIGLLVSVAGLIIALRPFPWKKRPSH
jgi:hypothetical protein